jgi:acetyl-CoA carboxylase carboxyltransferase component
VRVMHGHRLEQSADPSAALARLAAQYADDHLSAAAAAAAGFIDEVVAPRETRARIGAALAIFGASDRPRRAVGNVPL